MNTFIEFLNEATITLYHGDDYGTSKLNPKLMNNGNNQEGIGIYFSNIIDTAKAYGKDIVSCDIDSSKFINARELVSKHLSQAKIINMLKAFHKSNPEEFFYFVSDYIEVHEPEDVKAQHYIEMAKNVKSEQIRNFQTNMAELFGVELFVKMWNKEFPNIHGTYHPHNSKEIWYSIINTDLKLTKI